MADINLKSLEFGAIILDIEYLIKIFIISLPNDLELINIDYEAYKGFIYQVSIQIEPPLPDTILKVSENLIFVIGSDGHSRIGHVENGRLIEIEDNELADHIKVYIIEVLMMPGDSGHFILG